MLGSKRGQKRCHNKSKLESGARSTALIEVRSRSRRSHNLYDSEFWVVFAGRNGSVR